MRNHRLLALLIALTFLLPLLANASSLRGFDPKEGMAYALFGEYPTQADGGREAILFRVLSVQDDQVILLSDKVLDAKPANTKGAYNGFLGSSLDEWLQGAFKNSAFSRQEQEAIKKDKDRLFIGLPTGSDLRNRDFGFTSDQSRLAPGTPYALSKGLLSFSAAHASYWMEDPAQSMRGAQRRVLDRGVLGYTAATADNIGVRPKVVLSQDSIVSVTGAGSLESPFVFTFEEVKEVEPTKEPAPTPVPTPRPLGMVSIEGFPDLTSEGFLPEGQPEYIFEDAENGAWRYASKDLRIVIKRNEDSSVPLRWLMAEIFVRPGAETFKMVPFDKEHMLEDRSRFLEKPAEIAKQNKLVFSMDGDYFIFRVGRAKAAGFGQAIGVVIRDGEILIDKPASEKRNQYPPLDMMALFPDGDMKVYKAREITAQELVDQGARDVLSFGPYLIRDGEVNTAYVTYGNTIQPRAAIGMVEKGHYFAVIVEGRIRPSKGMTCRQVADLLLELGCQTAFNLDGGWTSAMVFMGKQLNQLDRSGVHNNARTQNEVMGIGTTTYFDSVEATK